jgi:cyclopropane fatty-acyl-phospholipid synthase-like methyltransferase
MTSSRSADHFERLYKDSRDPWGFATSEYERTKYVKTIETLGDRHFVSGLEIGCSVGVLTQLLASRCDHLLGVDIVEAPLVSARERCRDQPWVQFAQMTVPQAWPDDRFDLIVLSEVLYYFSLADLDAVIARVKHSLTTGGVALLVHWLGPLDDPTSGEQAARHFIAGFDGECLREERSAHYRIDLLRSGRD